MTAAPRVLFVSGRRGAATLRYRVRLAEEALRAAGLTTAARHFQADDLRDWATEADVVTFYRTPASPAVLDLLEFCLDRAIPTTFDVDDRVFLPTHLAEVPFLADLAGDERRTFVQDVSTTGLVIPAVSQAASSTQILLDEVVAAGDRGLTGAVLPNGIGRVASALADQVDRRRAPGAPVRIGYFSGSASHDQDWALVEDAVMTVLDEYPGVELVVVGHLTLSPRWYRFGARVTTLRAVPWTELPSLIGAVDINLAPLARSPFTEAKSAIKWLEAAVVRTPTVATATAPFVAAVPEGAGVLVPHGGDWVEPIASLVQDPDLRAAVGEQARVHGYREFGPDTQSARYAEFYRGAAALGDAGRAGARAAIDRARSVSSVLAEQAPQLEAYPFDDALSGRTFEPTGKVRR